MTKKIKDICWLVITCTGVTALLFILANMMVMHKTSINGISHSNTFTKILSTESPEGIKVLKRIFSVSSDEEALSRFRKAPNFEMHPSLHYMTARVNNEHYHIGVEGIRYDAGWTNEKVKGLLTNSNLIFLFGGSTMLGHGVSANETISWYLNQEIKETSLQAFNFGSQAYDFQRASEKLTYLLRTGFRPKKVVFLIGWNEIIGSARSNLRWQDKVIFHGFSMKRGEIAFTPNTSQNNNFKLMTDTLPIIQYLRSKQVGGGESTRDCPQAVNPKRDPFVDGFDFKEAYCQFNNWEDFSQIHSEVLKEEVEKSFKAHIDFIQGLSKSFGFESVVVFQPIGLFDAKNPFVTTASRETKGYKYLEMLQNDIRQKIQTRKLNMIDGSDWLKILKSDRYVDVAHYSPESNKLLAEKLYTYISATD
jgi:hypothetical protein